MRQLTRSVLLTGAVTAAIGSMPALAEEQVGRVDVSEASATSLTLYPDKTLVRQQFKVLPGPEGVVIVEGMARDWDETSLELEYVKDNRGTVPVNLSWQRGGLDRESLYRRLVGKSVELMGGGLNVPVQGVMLSYDSGMGLVQGANGRQYLVDWNDPQGIRLASRDTVFLEKDYQARLMAHFSEVENPEALRLSYITPSIRYSSHYRMTLSQSGRARLELNTLLTNNTDTDYSGVDMQLVAGDLGAGSSYSRKQPMMEAALASSPDQYGQRVGEVLVTKLPESTKLAPHSFQQVSLFKKDELKLEKLYLLDVYGRSYAGRTPSMERPKLTYRFKVDADLPAGQVRVYEEDKDGSAVISGNTWFPQTTAGDSARLTMGDALAVRVERHRLDNQQREGQTFSRWKATIFNDRDEAITFVLTDRDRTLVKLNEVKGGTLENTSMIRVKVPAQSQQELTYTSIYGH